MTLTDERIQIPAPAAPPIDPVPAARRTWSLRTSFWAVVAAQVLLLAASNFPTPLFPLYEQRYGFSSGVVTALFGVYVLALIPTLLTLGRLVDRVGRRPVLISGIGITIVSSLVFAAVRGVGWLFAGEIVYGLGGGLVMSSVAVAIRELHPKQDLAGGALAGTLANAAGLTLGPLVSGVLATITPWPTVSPYVFDIVAASLLVGLLVRIPETRPVHPAPAQRVPVIHVPQQIRRAFVATALAGATGWMLLGWVFGLSPSYLHVDLGVRITQPVVAGLFAAVAVVSNGTAQLVFRRRTSVLTLRSALLGVAVGMGIMVSSTLFNSLAVAVIGVVLAGASSGVVQKSTMATVLRIAPTHARGGVTSAFLTCCYLGLSVPVVAAGLLADRFGLGVVSGWYFGALAVLVISAIALAHRTSAEVGN